MWEHCIASILNQGPGSLRKKNDFLQSETKPELKAILKEETSTIDWQAELPIRNAK